MRWHGTFVQEGRTQAGPRGDDQRSHAVEAQAELFLHGRRDRLAERGRGSGSAACRAPSSAAASRAESTGRAAEQEDVKAARLSRFERQLDLDPDSLVSPDETATNTKMARRYGRAPRGERCRVAVPFGHWKAITVTAGPRTRGLTAKHGSMDR